MSTASRRWTRPVVAGGIIALLQAAALVVAILVWRAGRGSWGAAFYASYLVGLVLVAPAVGWVLAARRLGGRPAPWLAWPVSLTNFLVVSFGHGFEEAGFPLWTPVAVIAALSFVFGGLWFFDRGLRRAA
jgi:hypothetical protein